MADPGTMAVKVGMMALNYGLMALNKIEGPRLKSREVTTADYGTPMERFWGIRRLTGRPIFHAERLREKKVTSKTKGGKYSDYKYFGTFAVLIADHAIDKVSRVWMDKHLVYDVTKAGPISPMAGFFVGLQGSPVKLTAGKNFRIYDGTQTEPDPRYESWCEDRYGADSAPAYKDVAYLFFQDIPLEKFGNRIPQIDVEAVNLSSDNFLWDTTPVTTDDGVVFSLDYSRFIADGWMWDTATRARLVPISGPAEAMGTGGTFYRHVPDVLRIYTNDGTNLVSVDTPAFLDRAITAKGIHGDFVGITPFASTSSNFRYLSGATIETINVGFSVSTMEGDSNGNVWICGRPSGVSEVHLYCVSGPRQGDNHTIDTADLSAECYVWINSRDDFVVMQNANVWRLDSNFDLIDTSTITGNGTYSHVPGSDYVYRSVSGGTGRYNLISLTEDKFYDISDFVGAPNMSDAVYDPVNHAMVRNEGTVLARYFLDRIGGEGIDLGDVISDVADWCGVPSVDVSGLTQTVYGYSVVQAPGKDMIAPLLDIHDVDAHPHDFGIKFTTRGTAALDTIPVTDFVREGDGPRYTISIAQDTDLPAQISVTFADSDKDQQVNTVIAKRPSSSVDSERNQQIDLSTYVGTPGDIQKLADRFHRRKWNSRETVNNGLTAQYLALEPADLINLELDDVTHTVRAKKTTISQGRIQIEWERDYPSLNTLGTGTGAEFEGRDDDEVYVPSPTKGLVKDIPLTEDGEASDNPLLHYGAGNYGAGNFPGAVIYEGDGDGDDYLPWKAVEPADKATWGYATEALADANPWLWDRGNSVNVMAYGTLTSCTEADIDADPTLNLCLLGDELLNFTTATLESDGTYTLSGFKRGRRGTEWATGDHAAGDEFVLVSSFASDSLGLSDVGLTLYYKAQTVGRDVSEAPEISFAFTGATLKPYAPAQLKWSTDGTDLFGEIIRRTRIGGAWVGGSTIPLSENSEEYEVDIMDGVDVVRTITVTGTNTFTYTAAQISADGNSVSSPPDTNVYQMSDAVGRGFALAA